MKIEKRNLNIEFLQKLTLFGSGMAFTLLIMPDKRYNLLIWLLSSIFTFGILWIKPINFKFKESSSSVCWCLATLSNIGLGTHFYSKWIDSEGMFEILATKIGISYDIFIMALTIAIVIVSIPIVSFIYQKLLEMARSVIQSHNSLYQDRRGKFEFSFGKSLLILICIYWISCIALFMADFNYQDDLGRVWRGYKEWGHYGRILANALSTYVHMGNYLCDVSPLSQLLALVIVAIAGMILLYVYLERRFFSTFEIIALIPLGLNPYFLESLSYKYDAPYMALSVLASIMPIIFYECTVGYICYSYWNSDDVCYLSGIYWNIPNGSFTVST